MRYLRLYENFENLELPENFFEDCAPFISRLRKCEPDTFYYRGIKDSYIRQSSASKDVFENEPSTFIKMIDTNYDRAWSRESGVYKVNAPAVRPRTMDTPINVHNQFNKIFKEKFGWNVRDGIFTSKSILSVGVYGTPWIFFPIGNFKFCWSEKYRDFYASLESDMTRGGDLGSYELYLKYKKREWDYAFGPDSGDGRWYFKPTEEIIDEPWYTDAVEIIKKKYPDYTETAVGHRVGQDMVFLDDFEFMPSNDFDDYIINDCLSEEEFEEQKEKKMREIVDTYTNRKFCSNDFIKNEVIFKCDQYYILDKEYERTLKKLIWKND